MVDEGIAAGGICSACCLVLIIAFMFGGTSTDNSASYTDIDAKYLLNNESVPELSYGRYDSPPGNWNVINGTLTNGTYNSSDLGMQWDMNVNRKSHISPSDFAFVYNDGISDEYRGDVGLLYSTFNDTNTGCCYHVSRDMTRGIAFATKKSFDIGNFYATRIRYIKEDYYNIYTEYGGICNITLDNGTVIRELCIDEELTPEQKKYFDNYDEQLFKHYEEAKIDEIKKTQDYMDSIESEISIQNDIASKNHHDGFYGYSSNGGFMYGRYF